MKAAADTEYSQKNRVSMEIENPISSSHPHVILMESQIRSDKKSTELETQQVVNEQKINTLDAAMLLMTWSTSSSNVMYPWTFGTLGVVGGPLLMGVAFMINWTCTRWTIQAARATHSKTLGDLGDALYGHRGRLLLEGSQVLFQQLFLPVAIVLSGTSLQSLNEHSDFWSCNGNASLIFVMIAMVLIQMSQQLGHVVGLAYCSVALILLQTVAILFAVTATSAPNAVEGSSNSSWEYFVGQGSNHGDRYAWHNIFGALGVFIYSCLPNCIVVETLESLKPESKPYMERACDASFFFYIAIYLITGIPAVLCWGGNIPLPISDAMRNDWAGVTTKIILVYSTMLDFVLASVTVNRFLVKHLAPNYDFSFSLANSLSWAGYSLPSLLLATTMALLIPRLESLTGLLNSVTGTTVQVTAICVCLFSTKNNAATVATGATGSNCTRALLAAIALYGVILTIIVFTDAIYSITKTDYSSGSFWCDVVGR